MNANFYFSVSNDINEIDNSIEALVTDMAISENISDDSLRIDPASKFLIYEKIVGKRRDCKNIVYTKHEMQMYGKNRVLKNGEIAYLCRMYFKSKCKSRVYMKDGLLFKKDDFIEHNHPTQENERFEFEVEYEIKQECSNLDTIVNSRSQSSAVAEIFDKKMQK